MIKSKSAKSTSGKKKGRFKLAYTNRKETKVLSESGNLELSRELNNCSLSLEEKLRLSSWGLPSSIVWKYSSKGVTSLFQWQLDCLANEKVLDGRNLVYSAPTSAGKTLVAEILMVKRVLELGKKAIMILPFVSVAREKMYGLQHLFGDAGIRVEGMMGSYNPPGGFPSVDIAVCTIEKANGLINRLLEEGTLSQVGTIVVDELHLIGDSDRGYILELLLTKIKFMQGKQLLSVQSEDIEISSQHDRLNIQIVGMSATLPNLNALADWLDAELVVTDYRPVPLIETIKIDDKIYDNSLNLLRKIPHESLQITIPNDEDHLVYLALDTVLNGHSILIFCQTRVLCEKTADQIAKNFKIIGHPKSDIAPEIGARLREQLNSQRISEVVAQLKQNSTDVDAGLVKAVSFGVCFHHAGLTMDERDIIESAFKNGTVRVIVSTSTLSAGVNLPARRVVISSPMNYNNKLPLDIRTYKQMCGRAGRKGIDDEGESILICTKTNQHIARDIILSSLPPVTSTLMGDAGSLTTSMKKALMEVIASGVAKTQFDVDQYAQCTLLSSTTDLDNRLDAGQENAVIDQCLQFLVKNEFIRLRKADSPEGCDEYMGTQLGSACLASSLSPDESIAVFRELQKARECFVLINELHVIYQVTPMYFSDLWRDINWHQLSNLFDKLSPHERRVGELVGVDEGFMVQGVRGLVSRKNAQQAERFVIHQRFFTALALQDLVNEVPIAKVSEKFELTKGQLQNLQQNASTFAGQVTAFCGRLGWSNLELLLSQFQARLQFGVQRELCDLLRLSCLNGQLARVIYDAGIKNLIDLAKSDATQVEQIIHRAGSFISAVHGERSEARIIKIPGMEKGMSEQEVSALIVTEARQFFQVELGLGTHVEFGHVSDTKPASTSRIQLSSTLLPLGSQTSSNSVEIIETHDQEEQNRNSPVENESTGHEMNSQIPSSFDSATAVTDDSTPGSTDHDSQIYPNPVKEDSNSWSSVDWFCSEEDIQPSTSNNCNDTENKKASSHDDSIFETNDNCSVFDDSFPSFDERDFVKTDKENQKGDKSEIFAFSNKELVNDNMNKTTTKRQRLSAM